MLIWSGRGIIPVVLFFVVFGLSMWLPDSWHEQEIPFVIIAILTGIFSWVYGIKWNIDQAKIELDTRTGKPGLQKNQHSLFWIPMQYWGFLFPLLACWQMFTDGNTWVAIIGALLTTLLAYFLMQKQTERKQQAAKSPLVVIEGAAAQRTSIASKKPVEHQASQIVPGAKPKKEEKDLADMTDEERRAYLQQYMPK
ncbi:MAG: hypothetical protein AAGH46_09475 [Bacteroidota bacterium]